MDRYGHTSYTYNSKKHPLKIKIYSFSLQTNICGLLGASLVAQTVKNLLAMQETWIRFLGQEKFFPLLEKKLATHSSILAWRIPWTKEPGGLQSMGLQRVGHD